MRVLKRVSNNFIGEGVLGARQRPKLAAIPVGSHWRSAQFIAYGYQVLGFYLFGSVMYVYEGQGISIEQVIWSITVCFSVLSRRVWRFGLTAFPRN